jgi:hypothetical protein
MQERGIAIEKDVKTVPAPKQKGAIASRFLF